MQSERSLTTKEGAPSARALLEKGRELMAALGFSAADVDAAITAFETFRLGVSRVVGKEDAAFLEQLDCKKSIVDFLVDFQERKRKYSSRVAVLLSQLLALDQWRATAPSSLLADSEYTIVLTRKAGDKVGLSQVASGSLAIHVVPGSLMEQWNNAHPRLKVKTGDVVLRVNEVCGNAAAMKEEVKRSSKLELKVKRAEALAKSRWMFADSWNHAMARLDPLRWSRELPGEDLIRDLEAQPAKDHGRLILVTVDGQDHVCKGVEQVRLLVSSGRDLVPRRYYNALGWPTGYAGAGEHVFTSWTEEPSLRAAEDAVRADPAHSVCEVTFFPLSGWKVHRYTDPTEYHTGTGTRHLVFADAFINRTIFATEDA